MATAVPYNPQPEIQLNLQPTPYGHNQPPPGAFGGLTALATERLGSALSGAGTELYDRANALQLLDQQAAADEAASHFQMKSSQLHNDLLNRQGKDAADSLVPTLNQVEQTRNEIGSNLSPYAKIQYDRDTRRTQGMIMDSAGRHAAQQQKEYSSGALTAKSDTTNNAALSLPQDDANFNASLADKEKIGQDLADLHGWDPAKRDNWIAQQKSDLTLKRIEGIARSGDPFTANRMIDQAIANKTLIGQDIAKATIDTFYKQNTAGTRIVAGRILSGEGAVAGGEPVDMNVAATTVGQYMSRDNYDLISRTHNGSGQALGRYGVPTEKLSAWLKDAGMPDMSSGDFLKSHSAQDQLFNNRFGKLQDDTGNFNDSIKKWTGAEPTQLKGSGTAEQQQAFSYFTSHGWSADHAHALVATLSGESGSHLSTAELQGTDGLHGGGNGIANWNADRWSKVGRPQGLMAQLAAVDREARQMGINPAETGDSRALTIKLTGSADSGQGYERPQVNNGATRWAQYSGQRYAQDPVIQQANGLIAHNTPLSTLQERGKAMAADLAPNNPLFGEYLSSRIEAEYRQQLNQQKLDEDKNRFIVESALNTPAEDGHVPTTIEELQRSPDVAQAVDHSSGAEKLRIQGILAKNMLAGGVKFTPDSFQEYAALKAAAINPAATSQERQKLLDTNISDKNFPMNARNELFKLQQQVYKQEEASPQMGRAMRVLGPTLNSIGLDKTHDPDNYNSFVSQLHDAIQQHSRDSTRPITDDDIKSIGTQLLRDQPTSGFWSYFSTARKWYQIPVPAEYGDKVRADPRWTKVGIEPTDDMIHTMWVQQQFQQFYSKQRPSGAATTVSTVR